MIYFKKFYVTTPIYYVNAAPHLGHAYTTIVADILTRWHKLRGAKVFFLTGTDENSQKNVEVAKATGEDIQSYVNRLSKLFKETFEKLELQFDYFIRTTEERHKKGVEKFFRAVEAKGDIYKGKYVGLYCVGCEAFVVERELVDGKCSIHKTEPQRLEEENYFFKASKYKQQVLDHIKANPDFIQPEARRKEVIDYLQTVFDDISISRQTIKWGIPVPIDSEQVLYVWFDALINYLTGIGYGWDDKRFEEYWPADLHLLGKDIMKFHCALWPAMLLSAGVPLPKKLFVHGFFTVGGEKMSKSLGNVIDPLQIADRYSIDALRYFLIREVPFGEDGDFSEDKVKERANNELLANIGNFIHRTLSFICSTFDGEVPKPKDYDKLDEEFVEKIADIAESVTKAVERLELHRALERIVEFTVFCNQYFQRKEPWKTKDANCLYLSANAAYTLGVLLQAFIPASIKPLWNYLNVKPKLADAGKLAIKAGHHISEPKPLFEKFE